MKAVSVTVEAQAAATAEAAFGGVVPIDLVATFTGWGPFPAVTGVEHQPGSWDAAGKTRTLRLKGGGVLRERLTEYETPIRCAYEVVPSKGPLRLVVDRINGQFVFRELHHGKTDISWTYDFMPKRGARLLVKLLAPMWRRYATQLIARFVTAAEAAQALSKR